MLRAFKGKIEFILGKGGLFLLFIFLGVAVIAALARIYAPPKNIPAGTPVKIGYFHGGRTILLYRAYIGDYFENEGVPVELVTRRLNEDAYEAVPKSYDEIKAIEYFGKVRGGELLEDTEGENFDGATPGESSFIEAAAKGAPIVAVAELGHDTKEKPGHAMVFRSGVRVESSADIKGKILASRRAGAADAIFLREFLSSAGIAEKDVFIRDQVDEDDLLKGIREKKIDGAFFHLMALKKLVQKGEAYVYRTFNWINPELSHALLVFRKDFAENNPEKVEKILRAYMKRIKFERELPRKERLRNPGTKKGLQMEENFQGMNFPQYDMPPTVSVELLNEMQELMLKYGYLDKKVNLAEYIDNSFVEKIYQEGGF